MTGSFFLFLLSSFALAISAKWTVDALTRIAHFSRWREFVVAFFTVSLGAVAPEFFVGIISALRGIPELSFGNIVGQNIILLTLTVALSVFALKGSMRIESKTVKATAVYGAIAALLPLVLILDGTISRIDGLILILAFFLFVAWLFKREDRFTKIYKGANQSLAKRSLSGFFKDIVIVLIGFIVVIGSAKGLIVSALSFSEELGIALSVVGILIIAIGTGFPETYFSIKLARRGYSWMILGGLLGSVIISSTFVLGVVAIIEPIVITDISPFAVSRLFLIMSVLFFLFFMRTRSWITNREAMVLLFLYIAFVISLFIAR